MPPVRDTSIRRAPARLVATLAVALLATLCLAAGAHAKGSTCAAGGQAPARANLVSIRHTTLCLINRERVRRGLHRLRANARLRRAAQGHSRDMVARTYFEHTAPGGATMVDRVKQSGYLRATSRWLVGENLAWGSGSLATPAQIVRMWMHSPEHRANILRRDYRQIGIGISLAAPVSGVSAGPAATYTTDFGARS
jgi:uncharacterized protein YkwD